ncbi:MAG: alkane 1-monooxygenase [Bacteroidia bacterium]|nr:alkane 1-monooxygenase [Bacteroidia bacterium]MDW8159319.1 alkane 1-monooxygenase [Bacteroidia bacterium]
MKYCIVLLIGFLCIASLHIGGIVSWVVPVLAFGIIPIIELWLPPNSQNLDPIQEKQVQNNSWYDFILYAAFLLHYAVVFSFFFTLPSFSQISLGELLGRIFTFGISCGVLGINVAHELGHRSKKSEKLMAALLLLTSLYMHFKIEHNRGHHQWVGTPQDPSTARLGETIYAFWLRTIIGTYLLAWQLELARLKKKGISFWSLQNEMLLNTLAQLLWLISIFYWGGIYLGICYLLGATIGILLLESVNYIEHYGLTRKEIAPGHYEKILPKHSWNSDHPLGRILLFELSRHSDHHYNAARKYPILRHHPNSPQMPTGYPGMIMLALLPPLWFKIMHPKILEWQNSL